MWGRLRGLRREGYAPHIEVDGLEHVRGALARGRGVVVWCMRVGSATVIKRGFREQGLPLTHLSRVEHGSATTSRLGISVVAPLYRRVEDTALAERVQIPLGESLAYLRTLSERLAANACVSIFGEHPGRQTVEVDILGIRRRLALGAPSIAWRADAGLVTAYALRESAFRHRVVVRRSCRSIAARRAGSSPSRRCDGSPAGSRPVSCVTPTTGMAGSTRRDFIPSRCNVPTPGTSTRWWRGRRRTPSSAGRALARSRRPPGRRSRPTSSRKRTARTRWCRARLGAARRALARGVRSRPAHGAARAAAASPAPASQSSVADLRRLGLRDSALDLVVSPSTLDHFTTHARDRHAHCSRSTACCARAAPWW